MANKLIRIGFTQVIPANPGRPPTPPRVITTTVPTGGSVDSGSGGTSGNSPIPGAGGAWVYAPYSGNGSLGYGDEGYVWVPDGGGVPGTGVQIG